MKINVHSIDGLIQLKRNKKLKSNRLYLLSSESVANCKYFNSRKDIQYSHTIMQQKLSGILRIIDYQFTSKGWFLLVKFKSEKLIFSYYERLLKVSRNKDRLFIENSEDIISEQIRITISSIAKFVNKSSRRKGTLVARAFSRYEISSKSVFTSLKNRLKRMEMIFEKQKKLFNKETKWSKKLIKTLSKKLLCSFREIDSKNNMKFLLQVADIEYIETFVEQ